LSASCPFCDGHVSLVTSKIKCDNCGRVFSIRQFTRLSVIKARKGVLTERPLQRASKEFPDALTREDGPPYIRPWDTAGYDPRKYPKWMGTDPEYIKCVNCLHWDERNWYCFVKNRRTHPLKYWCWDFRPKGL